MTDIVPLGAIGETEMLTLAAAAEAQSEHPIAQGIVEEARRRKITVPPVSGFRNLTGEGIVAEFDGHELRIVSPGHLARAGNPIENEAVLSLQDQGKTVVFLLRDGKPLAALALADVIRPESRQAVAALKALGVQPVMLTGDARGAAQAVAAELGIDEVFAEVLPDQKASKVRDIRAGGRAVAVVGGRRRQRCPGAGGSRSRHRDRGRHRRGGGVGRRRPGPERPAGHPCDSRPLAGDLRQDGAELDLGDRLQRHRDPDGRR